MRPNPQIGTRRAWWRFLFTNVARRTPEEAVETVPETQDSELIVAVFRTIVVVVALFMPRVFSLSGTYDIDEHEIWLAAVAGIYNIVVGLSCLLPSRYGLRRPLIVTMDLLLITLWIRFSGQWGLFPFYYIVVVVAAMWFRVLGGALVAIACNFFFLLLWGRAAGDVMLDRVPIFDTSMALNTALLVLVGCLVGYVAEAEERERERLLESQLLIANYQREIDVSTQLQPLLMAASWMNGAAANGEAPAGALVDGAARSEAENAFLKRLDPRLEIGAAMKSARVLGGGDYFDLIPLEEGRTALCIADVSGKSVRAQARLPLLKYSLRALAPLYPQPDALLCHLNQTLAPDLKPELYIALCYVVLDPRQERLWWCNAGHMAPLLLSHPASERRLKPHRYETATASRASAERRTAAHYVIETASGVEDRATPPLQISALKTDGPALGMFPETVYEMQSMPWRPSDVLLLFTDGLPDALSYGGTEDGEAQVRHLASAWTSTQPARVAAQNLVDIAATALDGTAGHPAVSPTSRRRSRDIKAHRDDITVVVARFKV